MVGDILKPSNSHFLNKTCRAGTKKELRNSISWNFVKIYTWIL